MGAGRALLPPHFLRFHKQPHRAHVLIAGGGDVPAPGACDLPGHLQRDIMPAVREPGPEALTGVDAIAVHQQAGMGVAVIGAGEFDLTDLLFHGGPPCDVGYSVHKINREQVPVFLQLP